MAADEDVVVVDDLLLARIIATGDPAPVVDTSAVISSSLWWFRLARAVLGDGSEGRLSSMFEGIDRATRRLLVTGLPSGVTIRGMSTLAADAAEVAVDAGRHGVRLNALAAEAVAVTRSTSAALLVGVDSPALSAAAALYAFRYRLVG